MKIEYANTIPMTTILGKLRIQPVQQNEILFVYPSPFLESRPLSLHVNTQSNTWFDVDLLIGGSVIDFVKEHLKRQGMRCSVVDATEWLVANIGYPSLMTGIHIPDYAALDSKYMLLYKTRLLENKALTRLLTNRYIPIPLAKMHLKEVGVLNTANGKEFTALGLRNEEGGYSIRAKGIKAIVGNRGVSVIKGKRDKGKAIHIFKDEFDYLAATAIHKREKFDNKAVILNSYSCLDDSAAYITGSGYKRIYTWFDNGEIGQQATKNYSFLCSTQEDMQHKPMNRLYASGHDVSSWLIKLLSR